MGCFDSLPEKEKARRERSKKNFVFSAKLTQNLPVLFKNYREIVEHCRTTGLFSQNSQILNTTVDFYLSNPSISTQDKDINAIAAVHKLHPLDYLKEKPTKQWLVAACLRQHNFCMDFPYQQLNYESSRKHYVEFLYLCNVAGKDEITVPNKLADFMWHSHMQDSEAYQKDMKATLGKVLNHNDEYSPQQLEAFSLKTEANRKRYILTPQTKAQPTTEIAYLPYLDYNGASCGGGACATDGHADAGHGGDAGNGGHAGCGGDAGHGGHAGCGGDAGHGGHAGCGGDAGHGGHAGCGGDAGGHAGCGGHGCGGHGCGGGCGGH